MLGVVNEYNYSIYANKAALLVTKEANMHPKIGSSFDQKAYKPVSPDKISPWPPHLLADPS